MLGAVLSLISPPQTAQPRPIATREAETADPAQARDAVGELRQGEAEAHEAWLISQYMEAPACQ
jgi:hypothetical protein